VAGSWDPSLETGNALIDRQHRELIALVDQLAVAENESRDEVLRVLDHVMEYTLFHFVAEEDLMVRVDYPAVPQKQMIDQHQEFKSYGRLRVLEFRTGELASVLPLKAFLDEWLKGHEFGLDRLLADWIREQGKTSSERA